MKLYEILKKEKMPDDGKHFFETMLAKKFSGGSQPIDLLADYKNLSTWTKTGDATQSFADGENSVAFTIEPPIVSPTTSSLASYFNSLCGYTFDTTMLTNLLADWNNHKSWNLCLTKYDTGGTYIPQAYVCLFLGNITQSGSTLTITPTYYKYRNNNSQTDVPTSTFTLTVDNTNTWYFGNYDQMFSNVGYLAPDGNYYKYKIVSSQDGYQASWYVTVYSNKKFAFSRDYMRDGMYIPQCLYVWNNTNYSAEPNTRSYTSNLYMSDTYPSGGYPDMCSDYKAFYKDTSQPDGNWSFVCNPTHNPNVPIFDTRAEALAYLTAGDATPPVYTISPITDTGYYLLKLKAYSPSGFTPSNNGIIKVGGSTEDISATAGSSYTEYSLSFNGTSETTISLDFSNVTSTGTNTFKIMDVCLFKQESA